jgi:hypothetical protein
MRKRAIPSKKLNHEFHDLENDCLMKFTTSYIKHVISLIDIIEDLHSVKILKNTRILKDSITKRVSTKAFRMRWALVNIQAYNMKKLF